MPIVVLLKGEGGWFIRGLHEAQPRYHKCQGIVCLSNLLAIVALVFSILNKLVALNQMFREDTLKVLQSWKLGFRC